jgi:hypothetical protein
VVPEEAFEGERCLRISVAGAKGAYASVTEDIACGEGRSYEVSLRYRSRDLGSWRLGTRSPTTRAIFKSAKGKTVVPTKDYSWRHSDARNGLDEWAVHRHVFRTPPGTGRVSLTVFFNCPGVYLLDDLRLVEAGD